MSGRVRLGLTLATGAVALAVIVFSVVQLNRYDNQRSAATQVPAPLAIGTALQRPRRVPAMPMIDARGKPFSTARWRGKWVVLAPSMTLCHEVCPMTTAALDEIVTRLRQQHLSGQVHVAEVTVDPWRDSPARLGAYSRLAGVSFQQLTGTQAQIRRIWKFFGVYYARVPQGQPADTDWMTGKPEKFDVDHTDAVFLIDPSGQERILDEGMPDVGDTLPASLHKLLSEEGIHNPSHPQFPWTPSEIVQDLYYLMNRNLPASALAPVKPPSAAAAARALSDSPHPLAVLHQDSSRLVPSNVVRAVPLGVLAVRDRLGPVRAPGRVPRQRQQRLLG